MRVGPWHDVAGGVLLAAGALAAGPAARRRFLVGAAVGSLWEVPFALLKRGDAPPFTDVVPWPLPVATQPAVHALWDGGLLLTGAGLCRVLLGTTSFDRFRWSDLAVMTAWGSGQEVLAELAGNGRVWRWQARAWNPALVRRGDVTFTLLPHLAWALAPAVFHAALLRREGATSSSRSRRRRG